MGDIRDPAIEAMCGVDAKMRRAHQSFVRYTGAYIGTFADLQRNGGSRVLLPYAQDAVIVTIGDIQVAGACYEHAVGTIQLRTQRILRVDGVTLGPRAGDGDCGSAFRVVPADEVVFRIGDNDSVLRVNAQVLRTFEIWRHHAGCDYCVDSPIAFHNTQCVSVSLQHIDTMPGIHRYRARIHERTILGQGALCRHTRLPVTRDGAYDTAS